MRESRNPFVCKLLVSTAIGLGMIAYPGLAAAQTADGSPVEEVIVTGSAIPTAPGDVAVDVSTVDAAALKASGVNSNVLDIMRKQIPNFVGRGDTGSNDFTDTQPPMSTWASSTNNADTGTYCPIGRFVYVSASVKM